MANLKYESVAKIIPKWDTMLHVVVPSSGIDHEDAFQKSIMDETIFEEEKPLFHGGVWSLWIWKCSLDPG